MTAANGTKNGNGRSHIVATYDYCSVRGVLLYQAVRMEPKDFRQRRPADGGKWVWDMEGVDRVLYRLPELVAARPQKTVFIVEGEKDVDNLRAIGAVATTNVGGAGKWLPQYNKSLRDRVVIILPDNDEPGQRHARAVATSLRGVAAYVNILELPGLAHKGDVSDWLQVPGNDLNKLLEMAIEATSSQQPAFEEQPQQAARPAAPKKSYRALEPFQPFPLIALPTPINTYIEQCAVALGCDPAYVALPVLSVLASAIGNTRTIHLKRGWNEPAVVWSAIVGDSGTLKSPAYHQAVGALFELQQRLLQEHRQAAAAHDEALADHRRKKRDHKDGHGPDPGEAPEEPKLRKVVCSDATIEKLAEILEDNPRGTAVARDELAGWFGSFTRYKGKQGGTDLPYWLEMHRAGPVMIDRKTGDRRSVFIKKAAVSVTGSIQPGVLARTLTSDFLESGLAARLLMAMPPKKAKCWSEVEVHPDVEQTYEKVVGRLLDIPFRSRFGRNLPQALFMSPEAKLAWIAFYNSWGQEQSAVEGELAASYSKLEAYAARFALIHHVVTHVALETDDVCPIGPKSMECGILLAHWFAREARRIYGMFAETTSDRDCRRLVDWIAAQGGRVSARELMRSNSRKYPTAEAAEDVLKGLIDAGVARWVEEEPPAHGGHRQRFIELLPTHDTSDTRQPGEEG